MKKLFERIDKHVILTLIFAIVIFFSGVSIGYLKAPDVTKVSGIFNASSVIKPIEASEPVYQCLDAKGGEVSCDSPSVKKRIVIVTGDAAADFNQFWKAWNLISERYVPVKGKDVTNQEKVWGAISGLTSSLGDPYSYFMPPKEKKLFEQDVAGSFGGVGMQIGLKDGLATVISPMKSSPAERAGIKTGDKIIAVDGATTTEMTIDTVLYKIRGDIGTKVSITLIHADSKDPYTVIITREEIKSPVIKTEEKDGVFIIRLYTFTQTSPDLFKDALKEYAKSGKTKLIIDLRGNPGGYLESAVDIASWFLPAGKVVVEEKGKIEHQIYRSSGYFSFSKDYKTVILVDGGSASASEILAGALSQQGVATLIGDKTFGKGSVQELIPITTDTSLKLTIARWIMPNGKSLTDGGIDPDVVVKMTKEDVVANRDPQEQRAIDFLNGR